MGMGALFPKPSIPYYTHEKVHVPWKVLGVAFSLCREFYVFANSIRIAPWLWHIFFPGNWLLHCSKLCLKPSMPYYAHEKGPSTMAGPQRYEISSVSSTKGCSKQIHDRLTGGGFLPVQDCFCVGSGQILCPCYVYQDCTVILALFPGKLVTFIVFLRRVQAHEKNMWN